MYTKYLNSGYKNRSCLPLVVLIIFILISVFTCSAQVKNEKFFCNLVAKELKGTCEYVLSDKTRVDVVTFNEAIEVDFANKWAESIGQALHYSLQTNKKPAIVIIFKAYNDHIYLKRLRAVAFKYNIKVYLIFYDSLHFSLFLDNGW